MLYRSSLRRCCIKKDVLRNFAKFTVKHLSQSLFFNKVAGLKLQFRRNQLSWVKNAALYWYFLVNYVKLLQAGPL